jgi:hypothetical protein
MDLGRIVLPWLKMESSPVKAYIHTKKQTKITGTEVIRALIAAVLASGLDLTG